MKTGTPSWKLNKPLYSTTTGQNSGGADDASEVAYESTFFGSSSSGSSAPGSSAGRGGGPADADGDSGAGAGDAGAGGADSPSPTSESGTGSSGRTGSAVQGDAIEIEGGDTGNGFGLSHVGVTLEAGADGDATAADSERLCADALRLTGALIMADGDGDGDLLGTARDVNAAGHAYQCRPVAEKVLRCTAEDGSIVTLWSAEP